MRHIAFLAILPFVLLSAGCPKADDEFPLPTEITDGISNITKKYPAKFAGKISDEAQELFRKNSDIPSDVFFSVLETGFDKYKFDAKQREYWYKRQFSAFQEYRKILENAPRGKFDRLLAMLGNFTKDNIENWFDSFDELRIELEELEGKMMSHPKDEFDFAMSLIDYTDADYFRFSVIKAKKWLDVFDGMRDIERRFGNPEVFMALKEEYQKRFKDNPDSVLSAFYSQLDAYEKLKYYYRRGIPAAEIAEAKENLAREYPLDFPKQWVELESYSFAKPPAEKPQSRPVSIVTKRTVSRPAAKPRPATKPVSIPIVKSKYDPEKIARECSFVQRNIDGSTDVALLISVNGTAFVICPKTFIPLRMPIRFSNTVGTIVCSKGIVSDDYPVLFMIPDSVPQDFKPLEAVSQSDIPSLYEAQLVMLSASGGGWDARKISLKSEDMRYMRFSINSGIQEGAFVVDVDRRKLVSTALRFYEFGYVSNGKIGNVIGHETSEIPDYTNVVRMFSGNVAAAVSSPRSMCNFIRFSNLNTWRKFDIRKYLIQKNAVRLYTDKNNEYIRFFITRRFQDALDSPRLRYIAAKYEKYFQTNLGEEAFIQHYRNFITDLLRDMDFSMMRLPDTSFNNIYSIYKGEIAYQIALRQSMRNYLQEFARDGNLKAFADGSLRRTRTYVERTTTTTRVNGNRTTTINRYTTSE